MNENKLKKYLSDFYDKESLVELTIEFLKEDLEANRTINKNILYLNMCDIYSKECGKHMNELKEFSPKFKNDYIYIPYGSHYEKLLRLHNIECEMEDLINKIEKELYSEGLEK